jgi:hypothetical protein
MSTDNAPTDGGSGGGVLSNLNQTTGGLETLQAHRLVKVIMVEIVVYWC